MQEVTLKFDAAGVADPMCSAHTGCPISPSFSRPQMSPALGPKLTDSVSGSNINRLIAYSLIRLFA